MDVKRFAKVTQAAEEILGVYADNMDVNAEWQQCWVEWFNGCFLLKVNFPPGTKKTQFRWLLKARRMLQRETGLRWLFVIYRLPKLTDHEICYKYRKLIEAHGGGVPDIDLDVEEEGR